MTKVVNITDGSEYTGPCEDSSGEGVFCCPCGGIHFHILREGILECCCCGSVITNARLALTEGVE